MADFYDEEDGDMNVPYKRPEEDDFYGNSTETSEIEFQDFDHSSTNTSSTRNSTGGFGGSYGGLGGANRTNSSSTQSQSSYGSGVSATGGFGSPPTSNSNSSQSSSAASAITSSAIAATLSSAMSKLDPFGRHPDEAATSELDGEYSGVDFNANEKANDLHSKPPKPPVVEGEDPADAAKFWKIAYYRPLFNVDSTDVLQRLLRTVFIYPSFFDVMGQTPDLYGPFWIATTLIFALGAFGNFATYLTLIVQEKESPAQWHYDFTKVTAGALILYLYISLFPVLFWAVFKWFSLNVSLVENFCIYGYSLFPYLPAIFVMVVPYDWARWVMVMIAFALVSMFYIRNYFPRLRENIFVCVISIALMVVLNFGLALAFRLYFFKYYSDK